MIINPNIKARRLGYLKLLLHFLKTESGSRGFPTRFAIVASDYKARLVSYKETHGEITALNPRASALPYIELANELGLIKTAEGNWIAHGEAIHSAEEDLDDPFKLSFEEIIQFFRLLSSKDPLGLFIVFQLLSEGKTRYPIAKKKYESVILSFIDRFNRSHFLYAYLEDLCLKIKNQWSIDSFLLPRLHWYYDLNLVNLRYSLSKHNREEVSVCLAPAGVIVQEKICEIDRQVDTMSEIHFTDAIGNLTLT